jgi:hypothetical protein
MYLKCLFACEKLPAMASTRVRRPGAALVGAFFRGEPSVSATAPSAPLPPLERAAAEIVANDYGKRELNRRLRANFADTVVQLGERRICHYCENYYREQENIGRWLCRYHPRPYNPHSQTYGCCGQEDMRAQGCVACDHSSIGVWQRGLFVLAVPLFLVDTDAVRLDIPRDRRYNYAEAIAGVATGCHRLQDIRSHADMPLAQITSRTSPAFELEANSAEKMYNDDHMPTAIFVRRQSMTFIV